MSPVQSRLSTHLMLNIACDCPMNFLRPRAIKLRQASVSVLHSQEVANTPEGGQRQMQSSSSLLLKRALRQTLETSSQSHYCSLQESPFWVPFRHRRRLNNLQVRPKAPIHSVRSKAPFLRSCAASSRQCTLGASWSLHQPLELQRPVEEPQRRSEGSLPGSSPSHKLSYPCSE